MGRLVLSVRPIVSSCVLWLAMVITAMALGASAAIAPLFSTAILALALAVLAALTNPSAPFALLAAGLCFYIWPVTSLPLIGIDSRVLALGFFVLASVPSARTRVIPLTMKNVGVQIHLLLVATTAFSVLWSEQANAAKDTALGSATGWLSAILIATVLSTPHGLERAVRLVAVAGIIANATVWLVPSMVPDAYVGSRFAGLFANPNGLGLFLAFAIVALAFQSWAWRSAGVLAAPMLIATGSRSSLVALLIGILAPMLLAYGKRAGRRFVAAIAVAVLALGGAWVLQSPVGGDRPFILRSTDSRTQYWEETWQRFLESPYIGHGVGSGDDVFSVNSHLLLASDLGLPALALILAISMFLWSVVRHPSAPSYVIALIATGSVNSVFESWLYRGGSPYYVLFWSVVLSSSLHRASDRSTRHVLPKPSTSSAVMPGGSEA